MQLPVSTKDTVRFRFPADGPTYLLAVPSYLQRAAFRRDLRAAGADYPGDAALLAALREDLTAIAPANLEELLALVDGAESAANAGDDAAADPELGGRIGDLARLARSAGGRYAALEGDREFWLAVAPLVACQHFLIGWEGRDEAFALRRDRATDVTLSFLTENEVRAVGYTALGLLRPDADTVGNSASPSPSPGGPALSPPTSTPSLSPADGSCSESASTETPPTD